MTATEIKFEKTRYRGCTGFGNWFYELFKHGIQTNVRIETIQNGCRTVAGYTVTDEVMGISKFFHSNDNARAALNSAKQFAISLLIGGR